MENKERFNINLAPGMDRVEVFLREGAAPKLLEEKAPLNTDLEGTIGSVAEYLSKRIDAQQFEQKDCHIIVDRDKVKIMLVINENCEYRRGVVKGQLSYYPKFLEFGINTDKSWAPAALGLFIKMNRAFFPDRETNMRLVTTLMNFTATINSKVDRAIQENGNRTDCFTQIVNSNLPASFTIEMPIFKGMPAETIEVETFAQVNGRDVSFVLLSPGAQATLEELRNKVIDNELSKIKEIAPDIAIIEV